MTTSGRGPIHVGPASADEVVDLRARVLRAGQPRERARYPHDVDPGTLHVAARRDDVVVGVATARREPLARRARPRAEGEEETVWRLRGMAVAPEERGTGVGAAVLDEVVARVGERGCTVLWANARDEAVGFYTRMGWRVVSDGFDLPGIGSHHVVVTWPRGT